MKKPDKLPGTRAVPHAAGKKALAPSNETRLIEAAIRCLEKYGSAKTYIDDVAKEAGLSRQTAYRAFRTRQDLFEGVCDQRVSGMADRLSPQMKRYKSFEEALVGGTIASIRAAKSDTVFNAVLEAAGYHGLDRIVLKSESKIFDHLQVLWHDILTQARAEGKIRSDLSDKDIFEYMRFVQVFLISKDDLSEKQQREFLVKFMIPTLQARPYASGSWKVLAAKSLASRLPAKSQAGVKSKEKLRSDQ